MMFSFKEGEYTFWRERRWENHKEIMAFLTPEKDFNQKNRREFVCRRERERLTKGNLEKSKKRKRLINPQKEKKMKKSLMSEHRNLTQSKAGRKEI